MSTKLEEALYPIRVDLTTTKDLEGLPDNRLNVSRSSSGCSLRRAILVGFKVLFGCAWL